MDFSKRTTVFTLILFSLLFSFSHSANALSLSRAPYLQSATPNSITVRWRTDQLSLGEVSYGLNATNLNLSTSASNALSLDHEVTLTNLSANQRYYYSVGENGTPLSSAAGSVHHFDTPPNNGSAKSSRIWVLGDSGINDGGARAVRDSFYAKEISDNQQADLVLLLGDNAYANRRLAAVMAATKPIKMRSFPNTRVCSAALHSGQRWGTTTFATATSASTKIFFHCRATAAAASFTTPSITPTSTLSASIRWRATVMSMA